VDSCKSRSYCDVVFKYPNTRTIQQSEQEEQAVHYCHDNPSAMPKEGTHPGSYRRAQSGRGGRMNGYTETDAHVRWRWEQMQKRAAEIVKQKEVAERAEQTQAECVMAIREG
jgi:hypothetical protein